MKMLLFLLYQVFIAYALDRLNLESYHSSHLNHKKEI